MAERLKAPVLKTGRALVALESSNLSLSAIVRRGGRVAEGGGLLNRYTVESPYPGFKSLPLRQSRQGSVASTSPFSALLFPKSRVPNILK